MGYLDGSTITVDAVLTKQGRRLLAQGQPLGVTSFALTDTGVDYNLWNTGHPSGSAFYGEAIENLPQLEALPQAEYFMRNKLVTLGRDTTAMPILDISPSTHTFTENPDQTKTWVIQTLNYNPVDSWAVIVPNSQFLTPVGATYTDIGGVAHQYVSQQEIPFARLVTVVENPATGKGEVTFAPSPDDTQHVLAITFVSQQTGAWASANVTIPATVKKYTVKTN